MAAVAALLGAAGIGDELSLDPGVSPNIPLSEGNTLTLSDAAGEALLVLEVETMAGNPLESIVLNGVAGEIRHEGVVVVLEALGGEWVAERNGVRMDAVSARSDAGWTLAAEEVWYGLESHELTTEGTFVLRAGGLAISGQGLRIDTAGLEGEIARRGRIEAEAALALP